MEILNYDCIVSIYEHLEPYDLFNLFRTSKHFNTMLECFIKDYKRFTAVDFIIVATTATEKNDLDTLMFLFSDERFFVNIRICLGWLLLYSMRYNYDSITNFISKFVKKKRNYFVFWKERKSVRYGKMCIKNILKDGNLDNTNNSNFKTCHLKRLTSEQFYILNSIED